MSILANPNIIFVVIWSLVLALYSARFVDIYGEVRAETVFLISLNILVSIILFLWSKLTLRSRRRSKVSLKMALAVFLSSKIRAIRRCIKYLLSIYILIAVLDIIYSKGIPLVWALTGSARTYVDFGIPTLHGLANSIAFFLASFLTLLATLKVKNYKTVLVVLFVYQILILSRGTIIVMTVQILAVILFFSKFSFLKNIGLMAFLLLFIVGFGILGDVRQGGINPYYQFLNDEWIIFFNSIPSGFLWFYMYLTSGFNNLNLNMGSIDHSYLPVYTFAKLIPSAIYSLFDAEKTVDTFLFVHNGLNVSTIYSASYSDFGVASFLLVMIIQIVASYNYNLARAGSLYGLLSYVIVYQAIFLSFFIDTFFYMPFLFQFVIVFYLKITLGEKKT